MTDYEKLGVFYLGKLFDLSSNQRTADLLLYDSRDLVTHAVCVGMTGSGKTGLCIGLLEEAAIDGIPAIIIDPKGDLANLMLTFPELRPQDFREWINEDDARRKNVDPDRYAAQQAEQWRNGLKDWQQEPSRIQRLKDAADFAIYTPGSNAGRSVSLLSSFSTPPQNIVDDTELLRERIQSTVTGLLGLIGITANPLQSREHILLSNLLEAAWKQRQNLDLAGLVHQIKDPGLTRIGVMDLESFYPAKERFELSMMMNNLLASPGFSVWMEGEPLEMDRFLHSKSGKPQVSIFSIAHLNDSERMFFVTLLLTQVLGWMRTQSGTTSLRAVLYMDEIFGYFPPVANPPSKGPLLTLLKQARAYGLGVVLATQNPVDLDYKGLSNAGTWFIGRLQTDRDKERVLDGLEGANVAQGTGFDRRKMEEMLAGLQSRVFLMNNVHEDQPAIFQTRWCLSYLAGPLTREQIKKLNRNQPDIEKAPEQSAEEKSSISSVTASALQARPVLPPDIPQFFLPIRGIQPADSAIHYEPMLFASGTLYYADAKIGVASEQKASFLLPLSGKDLLVDWQNSESTELDETDLDRFPAEEASWSEIPGEAGRAKSYDLWRKTFSEWLFRTQSLSLMKSRQFDVVSKQNESERDFRVRLQELSREQRDQSIEKLRLKYGSKIAALQERIRKAELAVAREAEQASHAKMQTAISFGTTVLGALFGRKKISASTLGRATTAARGVGRSMKETKDIESAKENVEALKQKLSELETELKTEIDEAIQKLDPLTESFETYELRPKKTNISVKTVALVWAPCWKSGSGSLTPAWK